MEQLHSSPHQTPQLTILANTAKRCAQFVGSDSSLKIQTTNAQEIYNHYQVFNHSQILILDFRNKESFERCNFIGSINVPSEEVSMSDFLQFDPAAFSAKYCKTKEHINKFKLRKRCLVILVAFNRNCGELISLIPSLFTENIKSFKSSKVSHDELVAARNAILMQKILVGERNRYSYLCKTSFDVFQDKYPFMCQFENTETANTISECSKYPSEIFENCLYLSNCKVAKDANILQTLGITHILNVSDTVPNYFEDDRHLNIKYGNIVVEDTEVAPIEDFFQYAYHFVDQLLQGEDDKAQDSDSEQFVEDGDYNSEFDTQTLKLDLSTNTIGLWDEDDDKKAIYGCDAEISKTHRKHPKTRLLVHCAMGKSRSATIVTMYIMKKFKLPYKKAVKLVSQRREKIDINSGFIEKLKEFEANGFKLATDNNDAVSDSTEAEDHSPKAASD